MSVWTTPAAKRLGLVFAAMAVVLVGGVAARAAAIANAKEVVIAAGGFDPRAPLLGHYLAIRPLPSDVRTTMAYAKAWTQEPGVFPQAPLKDAWIVLAPGKDLGAWTVAAIGTARPKALAEGQVTARVRVMGYQPEYVADGDPVNAALQWDWGVNRIYLDERQAKAIEARMNAAWTAENPDAAPPPQLRLVLAIGEDGRAMAKGLIVDEERIETGLW